MKKKLLTLIAFTGLFGLQSQAQMSIYDNDFDVTHPLNCDSLGNAPSTTNFVDMGGNYLPNMDETITFCPDLGMGSKVSIVFATNIGFEFDIDPSDTLYIYDGPDITSPLLGAYNSGTNVNGFSVLASFINNPSGCLTVRFVSDGANEGTGWIANVACGDAPQPFYPHLEAYIGGVGPNVMNPLDTGYVDVCLGDSILLVAKPLFPYSLENTGTGYSQNVNNCSYTWTIGGVGVFTNEDDSLWFVPPARQGYFVDLRIFDPFPQPQRIACKIRVSQLPIFAGTGPVDDTICIGQSTQLIGGVTSTDTVGVEIPDASFGVGGVFAGLTPLPDGTGVQYETTIGFAGFNGATIDSPTDITSICLEMEHSYIGDIEIALTCPNGTMVSLMNAYNQPGGLTPGGCSNAIDICLGNDTDNDGGAPGSPTWTYCFSELNPTFGTICASALVNANTVTNSSNNPSMDPNGIWLPDGSFSDFIGCPIDGPWTITVQDNQGVDDGYIFQWGITFDAALYPEPESYQNQVVTDFWSTDQTIVSGQGDTAVIVVSTVPGTHDYVYNITDDFGCSYDTTVQIFTIPPPVIFPDTLACFQNFNVQGTFAFEGGVWSSADTAVHFSSTTALNPSISVSEPGTYTVSFTDNACGTVVSSDIFYPGGVYTQVLDTVLCVGVSYVINASENPNIINYSWNTGELGQSITVLSPGDYIVTATNECYTHSDTATIGNKVCDILAPNVMVVSSLNGNNLFFVQYEGVKTFECTILNRWGNLIYEYDDPAGGWDGRTKGGDLVDEGTYFYIIKAELEGGEELTKQGFVQVYH
jgi:subtilisin-like proprotein convertase family protein